MARLGLPADRMSDEMLLAGLGTGDAEVSLAFVRRFQAHVYAVALAVVGEAATAEDVAQQVFERVWRRSAAFDPARGSVRTWMTTITRNLAVDALRSRRSEPLDPTDVLRLLASAASSPEAPEAASLRAEARAQLTRAIHRLPAEQARAVVMAGVYRMTAREVACAESIPLGTAKTRIRAAMGKLRDSLATEVRP